MTSARWRELAWIGVPFAVFLLVLQRLWFDAPVWDDYDAVLSLLLSARDAHGAGEWLALLTAQHNEHRIVVGRLATLALNALTGSIDFRALVLLGNLSIAGVLLLLWREFRGAVPPMAFGIAAFLALQWSYWEASMMASAALAHLTVLFFAFGAIALAFRPGRAAAAGSVVLAVVAAGCQANGLFVLPLCAACCALSGRRSRAALHAILALAVWLLYFQGFASNPGHPSALHAFDTPLATLELFLVNVGSIVPNLYGAMAVGVVMVAGSGWLAWRCAWKTRPVPMAWIAFLLGTAGAAAMARVGLGVVWQSRYAAVSAMLAAILALCAMSRVRVTRGGTITALAAAILVSVGVSALSWPDVRARSLAGRMLHESAPATPEVRAERFVGEYYPDRPRADGFLARAADLGIYTPPRAVIQPTRIVAGHVAGGVPVGHVDEVKVDDRRVTVIGWTIVPATARDRTFMVRAAVPFERADLLVVSRPDVARALDEVEAVYGGFVLTLQFASAAEAAESARAVCVVATARGERSAAAMGPLSGCQAGS